MVIKSYILKQFKNLKMFHKQKHELIMKCLK